MNDVRRRHTVVLNNRGGIIITTIRYYYYYCFLRVPEQFLADSNADNTGKNSPAFRELFSKKKKIDDGNKKKKTQHVIYKPILYFFFFITLVSHSESNVRFNHKIRFFSFNYSLLPLRNRTTTTPPRLDIISF